MKEVAGVMLKETAFNAEIALRSCSNPEDAAALWDKYIKPSPRYTPGVENFIVLHLNTRRHAIGFHIISTGTLDTALVHPREVFRTALIEGAAALVLMHNHPSGDPTPSDADIRITRELVRAGQILKTEVLDHVIVGDFKHISLKVEGYFL